MKALGYAKWRRMEDALDRARASRRAPGCDPADHFTGAGRMIEAGKGAVREVVDYHPTRYSCYPTAMNGDPRKPEIAAAQRYFVVRTRDAATASTAPAAPDAVPIIAMCQPIPARRRGSGIGSGRRSGPDPSRPGPGAGGSTTGRPPGPARRDWDCMQVPHRVHYGSATTPSPVGRSGTEAGPFRVHDTRLAPPPGLAVIPGEHRPQWVHYTMYIVWKQRPVKGSRPVPFLQDDPYSRTHPDWEGAISWKPLRCEHHGASRVAWTALVVHAERRDGKPRQKLLRRLPTIRSCCVADRFCRAAWWFDVEQVIRGWKESYDFEYAYIARDEPAIRARLRAVVPPPKYAGRMEFAAYYWWRQRELEARRERIDPAWWRDREEEARRPREPTILARRRADLEWGLYEQARAAAEASARCCADGWGRRPPVDRAERQGRTRRAEADGARFEQALREHVARTRRWAEARVRRQEEQRRRAEEQQRRLFEELLGRSSAPPWYMVLGLAPTAAPDEVKRRYRELAMRHHPDRGGDALQFSRITEAYHRGMGRAAV